MVLDSPGLPIQLAPRLHKPQETLEVLSLLLIKMGVLPAIITLEILGQPRWLTPIAQNLCRNMILRAFSKRAINLKVTSGLCPVRSRAFFTLLLGSV